jgi:hypothetical protein
MKASYLSDAVHGLGYDLSEALRARKINPSADKRLFVWQV